MRVTDQPSGVSCAIRDRFYRLNADGGAVVLRREGHTVCTRMSGIRQLYPLGSRLTVEHEHPDGIVLALDDAKRIGLTTDGELWNVFPITARAPRDRCPGL